MLNAQSNDNPRSGPGAMGATDRRLSPQPDNTDRRERPQLPSPLPSSTREQVDLIKRIENRSEYRAEDRLADLSTLVRHILQAPRASGSISPQLLVAALSGTAKLTRQLSREDTETSRAQRELSPELEAMMPHLRAVTHMIEQQIGTLEGGQVAKVVWALGALGLKDEKLLTGLSRRAAQVTESFSPKDTALTSWGFAALRFRDESLLRLVSHRAQALMADFTGRDVANVAWAFATLAVRDDGLFRALSNRFGQIQTDLRPQDLTNTAWALSLNNPELVPKVCSERDLAFVNSPTAWLQRYHALLIAGVVTAEHSLRRCSDIERGYKDSKPNKFERDVRTWLINEVGVREQELGQHTVVKGIGTDWTIERNGVKLIIECDGDRWHRSVGPDGDVPLGRDLIQDKVFEACGYRVVHIRDSEFYQAPREALRARVQAALLPDESRSLVSDVARAAWWVVSKTAGLFGRATAAILRAASD